MGLSNEERIQKTIWASNRLTSLGYKLNPESDEWNYENKEVLKRLKDLCMEVIPTMSSEEGNSAFWLLGADTEVGFSKSSLWSLALRDKIKYAMTPEADEDMKARKKKKEDLWGKQIEKHDRNLFEIEGYLSEQHRVVYDIHSWCQQFMYASNRYRDDLSKSYSKVNGKISLIMNECFNIFNSEDSYAIAYLKSKVFPLLLGTTKYSKYEDWDELTRYIIKNHRQFVLKNYGDQWDQFLIDELKRWWIELEKKNDSKTRFWIWLFLFEKIGVINSDKEIKEIEDLCKSLKIPYKGKVERSIKKGKEVKKDREKSWSEDYQSTKDYDREDIQERTTDGFHFILNED